MPVGGTGRRTAGKQRSQADAPGAKAGSRRAQGTQAPAPGTQACTQSAHAGEQPDTHGMQRLAGECLTLHFIDSPVHIR